MQTMTRITLQLVAPVAMALLLAPVCGCNWDASTNKWSWGAGTGAKTPVPDPINLTLPKTISFHPFTGSRVFGESGGVQGIDARLEAKDAFGDSTKAFGEFRFELYRYKPNSPDPRGQQLATWEENLTDPKKNLTHWDGFTRSYEFKLRWEQPIAIGDKFIMVAVFSSPFTERKFTQREFISGQ